MQVFRRIILALVLITAAFTLKAQVVNGTIAGTVTDSTGALVPNAHVLVHNDDNGTQRTLTTNSGGTFTAPAVPVGSYTVTIDSPGFAHYTRKNITVTVGQTLSLTLSLAVAGTESVTVTDDPSTINISTEQTSGLIDSRQVKQLPLNGRSFDQLLTLNPGVVNYTNQRSGGVGTSNSSVGSQYSISGRRPQDNLFLLNGIEYTGASLINTTPGGTSGQLLGVDGIREFNVVSDTYSASYGKRDGAQISISTTSGTNKLHGSVYDFERNSFFDARNYFDQARIPEFQRDNYGASLGGPIKHNKLFLFANYEGYRQNLGESIAALVPDAASRAAAVASVQPLLNLWPVANGPESATAKGVALYTGTAPQHIREDFGTSRLDYNIGQNDTLNLIYTIDDSYASTPTADPFSYVNETLREQVGSLQEQHVFTPNLINVFRAGFSRSKFYFYGYVPAAEQALTPSIRPGVPTYAVVIGGSTASNGPASIATGGANVGSNNGIARTLYTVDNHAYYTIGKHTIQGGVWLQTLQSNDNLAQDQYGQASFASIAALLAGTIKTFTYAPNITELNWQTLFASFFLEDTYHITPRLQVRAGFRSETSTGWSEAHNRASVYTFNAGVISTTPTPGLSNALTTNNALFLPEPRLGIAWNVFGNGKTSVTSGVGLHHSLLDALDYRLDQSAPYNTVYTYSGTTVANPISTTPLVSPSNTDTSLRTPTLLAYDLKLEQQLAPSTSLTIGYIGSHSYHQILSEDLNEPAYTIVNGSVFYPASYSSATPPVAGAPIKANPAVANTTTWVGGGSGNYNAFTADFKTNVRSGFASGLQFRANYTWSKNLDDGSAWNTSVAANTPAFVSVPSRPHLDYGPAATDLRQLAAANASYDLPFGAGKEFFGKANHFVDHVISGWTLSTIANLTTGTPFSGQLGYNPTGSGDSRNPVRPDLNTAFIGSPYNHGSTSSKVTQYFNPAIFAAPKAGYVGNSGRDNLVGPAFADWDVSLLKATQITEAVRLQFRAEFFNVLNHTNLGLPNPVVYSTGPTQGTLASQATVAALGSPGNITSTANTSRQIQLGVKLLF